MSRSAPASVAVKNEERDPPRAAPLACDDPAVILNAVRLAANPMLLADDQGRICWINAAFTRLFGYASEEVLGQAPRFLNSGVQSQAFYREQWDTIRDGRVWRGHMSNRNKSGEVLEVDQTVTPVRDASGKVAHYYSVYEDLGDRLRGEQQLMQRVLFDSLTGLPNRNQFLTRVVEGLARARRNGKTVAVLLLNLDRFGTINQSFGHAGGDELLGQVGRCLASGLRDTDLVAHLAGDEYALLIEDLLRPEQAIDSAQRLLELMSAPFMLGGTPVPIGASIGIAHSGDAEDTPERLLHNAHLAMLQAKTRGRMCFQFYDVVTDAAARRRHNTRSALRLALRHNRLSLAYQPQVDLRSGQPVGAEALLRWNDPLRGWVPPTEFIAIAEQDGMIFMLNDWVLHHALAQMAVLRARIPRMVPVAVNLSAGQFDRVELAPMIEGLLDTHGLPGSALRLEITETVMLRASPTVHENLRSLARMGVQVSVDDFGTGYSSLPSLREFPLSAIKLDIGYVRGIGRSRRDEQLVSAIIGIAQKLGLGVIAEGVETAEQRDFLLREGCTVAQGHFYQHALPAEEFIAWMNRGGATEEVESLEGAS